MDALDEVYTSWMRDIRLGKSRLMIAKSLLDNVGTGNGQAFNAEQEAYSSMNLLAGADSKLADQIQQVQFNIRVQEHKETSAQLVQDILRLAGYSSETFGIYDGGGPVKTATEIESKQQRSLLTRDRKIRLWRPAIARIIEKLLAVDNALFNTPLTVQQPDVWFPDGVQDSPLSIAQTVQALKAAGVISDQIAVGMVHPDWDEDEVLEEVKRIQAEQQAAMPAALPDPMFMNPTDGSDGSAENTDAGVPAVNG